MTTTPDEGNDMTTEDNTDDTATNADLADAPQAEPTSQQLAAGLRKLSLQCQKTAEDLRVQANSKMREARRLAESADQLDPQDSGK